ncbi:MAG: hypothetical protein KDK25_06370 [Leptospiraceae bacterium]|nr:hypothetical protein [Leptospiraceae bacterium]
MKRTLLSVAICVFLIFYTPACSSTFRFISEVTNDPPPTILGGTEINVVLIYGATEILGTPYDCGGAAIVALVYGIVDLLPSLAMDVLLLPVTVPWTLLDSEDEAD